MRFQPRSLFSVQVFIPSVSIPQRPSFVHAHPRMTLCRAALGIFRWHAHSPYMLHACLTTHMHTPRVRVWPRLEPHNGTKGAANGRVVVIRRRGRRGHHGGVGQLHSVGRCWRNALSPYVVPATATVNIDFGCTLVCEQFIRSVLTFMLTVYSDMCVNISMCCAHSTPLVRMQHVQKSKATCTLESCGAVFILTGQPAHHHCTRFAFALTCKRLRHQVSARRSGPRTSSQDGWVARSTATVARSSNSAR